MRKILVIMVMLLVSFSVKCNAVDFVFYEATNSRLLTKSGSLIGKGAVEQTMFGVDADGFYVNLWGNHGFSEGKNIETDLVIGKKISSGKFSGDFNFQRYMANAGNENMLEATLRYKGDVNVVLVLTRQITGGIENNKNRAYLEIGKPISAGKLVVMPSIASAYLDNFYGTTGWAHVTGKVRADYALSKNISVFAQVIYQDGLMSKKMDLFYGSGGVKLFF